MTKIELKHVSKTIHKNEVLHDISFMMESGKIYGFQGVNGSGKTMLMRIIIGLIHPTNGSVEINGKVLGRELEIKEVLSLVGLNEEASKKKYRKYSLGMKQRLGIAAAIMENPDIIILDEPTNALDTAGVKLVKGILQKQKERGALCILSCHDLPVLESLSDEIIKLEEGKIIEHISLSKAGGGTEF